MRGKIENFKEALKKFAQNISFSKGYKQGNVYVLLNALQSGNQDLFISRFLRIMNAQIDKPGAPECLSYFNDLLPLPEESFKKVGYLIVSALMSVKTIKSEVE